MKLFKASANNNEINNVNKLNRLKIPNGRQQTSWLFTNMYMYEDLN